MPTPELQRDDLIWRALADPTRRRVLDLLRVRPRTTGQIASEFEISRIAVMRHLVTLAESGLVVSRKRGRERWHYINAVPLQRLHDRWVRPLEAGWAESLIRFERSIERGGARTVTADDTALSIDIAQDVLLKRPRRDVFVALIEPSSWWGPPYVSEEATDLRLDSRVGGALEEAWGEGGGRLLASVTAIDAGRTLELTGRFHFGVVFGVAEFVLEDEQEGTRLRFSYRAIGDVSPEEAESLAGGWNELVGSRLVAFVERGEELGLGSDRRYARHRPISREE
jgi:DNA-binding transcriptional ArsR family regulator